jgi:glycosyltransferase involved in cell wall biosynthesis
VTTAGTAGKRITVVTAGHVSACPRMLKAADAFMCAGYLVRVVGVNHTPWTTATDAAVHSTRKWAWSVVDYAASTGPALRRKTGMRFKAMQAIAKVAGPARVPIGVAIRAYSRAHDELVRAVTAEPADFIYGGSTGALAAVVEAAATLGVPYGIDFEDFHSGELSGPGSELPNALAARVERHVIPGARFITAGSPMIAETYNERYGVRPLVIHNTFSIAPGAATDRAEGPLRLYWFSQTLGPQRGLEDVVRAAGEARVPVELHLRAHAMPGYLNSLRQLAAAVAPQLELVLHDPASPDDMVKLAQPYDAGLACEEPYALNRRICLTNKIFTYLAAGVPVLLTRTPAQARLEPLLGDAAFGYECGDVSGLARTLRLLANDAALLRRSRAAARAAAGERWHWEHPEDRGALLAAVKAVV